MPARAVQISLDHEFLSRLDRDPEVRALGRSAFIRKAIAAYLEQRERRLVDSKIRDAFGGHADEMLAEVADLLGGQAWPDR